MATEENIVALQAWGVFPQSRRRRRRAVVAWLGRTVLYIAVVACIMAVLTVLSMKYGGRPRTIFVPTFMLSWLTGIIFCALAPFQIETKFGRAHVLRRNLHDYYLAGIRGEQILAGIAAPQMAGRRLFAFVYPVVMIATFSAAMLESPGGPGRQAFTVLVLIALDGEFMLIVASRFHLALWTTQHAAGARLFLVACFVFLHPAGLLVWHILSISRRQFAGRGFLLCFLALASFLFWYWIAAKAWSAAVRRLDQYPGEISAG